MQCYSAHHEYIEPSEHGDYYLASEADAALAAKDARIAELEKALRKYGRHLKGEHFCAVLRHSINPCDCGFDKAVENS